MALCALIVGVAIIKAQSHNPILPPVGKDPTLSTYGNTDSGFWCAGQANIAYSTFLTSANTPYFELDFVGGYRLSQYLKPGIGIGGRYYSSNGNVRVRKLAWSMPLFVNLRGNIVDETYRDVVPYYSVDLGGVIRDGFMWRPSIGLRVGQKRSAFTAAVTYTLQTLKYRSGKDKAASFVGVTLGYEY